MFSHSNPSLLPLVGDIVQDVFLTLDMSCDETSPLFCTVLHSLMKALARWFLSSVGGTSENKGTKKAWCEQDQLNVRQFVLDYHKQKDLAEGVGGRRRAVHRASRNQNHLLLRLTADDPLAALQAFRVLCPLWETCRGLLRKRVSKEVLPTLIGSLSKQAPVSVSLQPHPVLQPAAGCAAGPGGSVPLTGPRGLRPGCCN